MEQDNKIYALYDEKHKNKIVALMNTLNIISELSVEDVVELLNNYEKDVFHYEQLLRKNAKTIDSVKKELFTYKLHYSNANNTTREMQATIDKLRYYNKLLNNELYEKVQTIDKLNKKIKQLEDENYKNIHTYEHCYNEVSNKLYAYKQLFKSLARNAAGIQDICSNAANCDEISCNGKKVIIKNGKQIIEMEFDNGK